MQISWMLKMHYSVMDRSFYHRGQWVFNHYYLNQTADRIIGKGNYIWSAFGAGRNEFPVCMQSILLGGNVRVGLEDNLYVKKSVLAKSNGDLVQKMVRIMDEFDFEPATPAEAREILGLKN